MPFALHDVERKAYTRRMYDGDSFFTLTMAGRIGLVVLSTVMFLGTLYLFHRASRRVGRLLGIAIAVVFLWLFVWLSPQIYYLYYMLIFDFLELKRIPDWPPDPIEIARLLFFIDDFNLSKHGKGILGWIMIVMAIWPNLWKRGNSSPTPDQDR